MRNIKKKVTRRSRIRTKSENLQDNTNNPITVADPDTNLEIQPDENIVVGKHIQAFDNTFVYDKSMEVINMPDVHTCSKEREKITQEYFGKGKLVQPLKNNKAVVRSKYVYGYLDREFRSTGPMGLEDWEPVTKDMLDKEGIQLPSGRFTDLKAGSDNLVWQGDSFLCRRPVKNVIAEEKRKRMTKNQQRDLAMERLERSGLKNVMSRFDYERLQGVADKNPSIIIERF